MGNVRQTKQPQERKEPTLATLSQASAELGVPYTSLRDLVVRGHLPVVRLPDSRRIWVRRADLKRLIDQCVEVAS